MSVALRRIASRVAVKMNATDSRHTVLDRVRIDQELCEAYIELQAFLPAPTLYTASAFTISVNADTFTLPSTVTQWTANDGGAEYAGEIRIRMQQAGYYRFLKKITNDEMDAFKDALPSNPVLIGIPAYFSLYEGKDQAGNGRVYPGAQVAQPCDLWASLAADDLRDFIGSGSDDLDDVKAQLSRGGVTALIEVTAGRLLAAMDADTAKAFKLDKSVAAEWKDNGWTAAYRDYNRQQSIQETSDTQRRVG